MARRGENIYKRKVGSWEGRYKNGSKPDGTVKYSSVYGKTYSRADPCLIMFSGEGQRPSEPSVIIIRKHKNKPLCKL